MRVRVIMPEIHIVGTLRGASHLPSTASAAFCRFELVAGAGWVLLDGALGGTTQTAAVDFSRGGGGAPLATLSLVGAAAGAGAAAAAWEHPLDARFAVTDVAGWPQLCVTVWTLDALGRADVAAYGTAFVPVSPGEHRLEHAAWRPEGTWLQELRAAVLGAGRPQLVDDATLYAPAAATRHGLVTATAALVDVELAVVARGFAEAGASL